MAVLLTPFFLQFVDDNGVPVSGGKVYTYSAGTTTPKATFTDFSEVTQAANPVILDSAGRATIWISGSYAFELRDANDVVIRTTDHVTAFSIPDPAANAFFQSLSGDGATTVFTVSANLGTDEKSLLIFVNNSGWIPQNPSAFTISGTTLTFVSAPPNAANNIYVFAPSLLLGAAATSATDAATSATAAAASAVLAQDWATKTTGLVAATDDSSKAYAIGGTGVTNTAGKGASKEWATKTSGTVDTTEFSAKEYAGGSQAATGGSAKNWAKQTGADVTGASANDRSAKSWAQETITGATLGGSSKDWAQSVSKPDGTNESSKTYAGQASTSATAASGSASSASSSATTATTQAGNASTSATAASSSATAAASSATSASGSATSASSSSTTATTQATNAATSASSASTSATAAATSATSASTSATTATTQATNASASATAAAASAVTAASQAAALLATSATSKNLSTFSISSSESWTTQAGKQFIPGGYVLISSTAVPTDLAVIQITSYSGTTLTGTIIAFSGTGTHTDWNISISGARGQIGATGPTGSGFGTQQGLSISAGVVDLGSSSSRFVLVTDSSGTITSFGSAGDTANPIYLLQFNGGPTIQHGANLGTPGSVDIITENVDYCLVQALTASVWGVIAYFRKSVSSRRSDLGLGTVATAAIDTDTALSANSDVRVASQKAIKAYVDAATLGLDFKPAVRVATTAALTVTYVAGVLTNAGTLSALSIDGVNLSTGDRVLVKNQASALQNGWYSVTTVGSGAIAWVMTRTSESDVTGEIVEGDCSLTEEGTSNAGTMWFVTTSGTITIGTTGIAYTQLAITSVAASALTGTLLIGTFADGVITASKLAAPASLQNAGTAGGTANAQTLTPTPALTAYAAGDRRTFLPVATNTSGTVTVNVSALGTKNILKSIGGALVALSVGDLVINVPADLIYDGTQYVLMNPGTYGQGANIASAGTLNLDTATGDYVHVTGTTTITAVTLAQGRQSEVVFDGILTLTNGASLILPTGANITTAAGDVAVFRGEASGVVRCTYFKADGTAPAAGYTRTQLAQNTTTGGATMSVTGLPASGYKDLEITAAGISFAAASRELGIEVSAGSGFTQTYMNFSYGILGTAPFTTLANANRAAIQKTAGGAYFLTAAQTATVVIVIKDYANTNMYKTYFATYKDTAGQELIAIGTINTLTAIDGAQVYIASGGASTIDAGTLTVKGIN